jgi:hypothetical protein
LLNAWSVVDLRATNDLSTRIPWDIWAEMFRIHCKLDTSRLLKKAVLI